jgi:DNA-binding NarL/FixJ family response regulator
MPCVARYDRSPRIATNLSQREIEVLRLIADGLNNTEIAQRTDSVEEEL